MLFAACNACIAQTINPTAQHALGMIDFLGASTSAIIDYSKTADHRKAGGDKYEDLAHKIAVEIHEGRGASKLAQAPFQLISNSLTIAAVADIEPISKTVAAISAFAAQKFGEAAGAQILEEAQQRALQTLKRGLAESRYTPSQLQSMSKEDYLEAIKNLTIGNERISNILQDIPEAQAELSQAAEKLHQNQTIATLATTKEIQGDVREIKENHRRTYEKITEFARETGDRLGRMSDAMQSVNENMKQLSNDLQDLNSTINNNTETLRTIAQISSMNWSADQKLLALKSGYYSNLTAAEAQKLEKSLESEIKIEKAVKRLSEISEGLGYAANIAQSLGLDQNIIKGAQAGQIVATALAQFSGGPMGYLAGASTLTALGGLGGGQSESGAIMAFLRQQLAIINEKLDKIYKLQIETLSALQGISAQLANIQEQITTIEYLSAINNTLLQHIVNKDWRSCQAVLGGMNYVHGEFLTKEQLINPISNATYRSHLQSCYRSYHEKFHAHVLQGEWGGASFGLLELPSDNGGALYPGQLKDYEEKAKRIHSDYLSSRAFLLTKHYQNGAGDFSEEPAYYLAAILDPQSTIDGLVKKMQRMQTFRNELKAYTCGNTALLSQGIGEPLCFGSNGKNPDHRRWPKLLNISIAGPNALSIVNMGIPFTIWLDMAYETDRSSEINFVTKQEIERSAEVGPVANLRRAGSQRLGSKMLTWLEWLNTGYLLQYSVAYGDFTAYSIVETLFDASKNSLYKPEPSSNPTADEISKNAVIHAAISAIKTNEILARNVAAIAIRRALTTPEGALQLSLYTHGFSNALNEESCKKSAPYFQYLKTILPNWNFETRVLENNKKGLLEKCKPINSKSTMREGFGINFENHFISLPNPLELNQGALEQPASIKIAANQRDRLTEVKSLRNIRNYFPQKPSNENNTIAADILSSQCLTGKCKGQK